MFVAALTGEVGAGKSTVARWFKDHGVTALPSADDVVKAYWEEPWLRDLARRRWGRGIFRDGAVDYRAIALIIFSDSGEYRWLCRIVHPAVLLHIKDHLPEQGLAITEIPMLFESGRWYWMDGVIFVTAPAEIRAARNSARGLDAEELARREKFFLPREERISSSDWVVDNRGDMDGLETDLQRILEEIRALDDLIVLRWSDSLNPAELSSRARDGILFFTGWAENQFSAALRRSRFEALKNRLPEGYTVGELRGCTVSRRRVLLKALWA